VTVSVFINECPSTITATPALWHRATAERHLYSAQTMRVLRETTGCGENEAR
jgi:hypothetical protein